MFEDMIIVSIDESNFRSDTTHNRQWSFDKTKVVKHVKHQLLNSGLESRAVDQSTTNLVAQLNKVSKLSISFFTLTFM